MAYTVRNKTSLETILAVNGTEGIGAQDILDFMGSVLGVYAEIYIAGNSTAQNSIGTSFVTVDWDPGTNGADGLENNADADYANDRIQIGTGGDGVYEVHFQASLDGSASATFTFALAINGTETTNCRCVHEYTAATEVESVGFSGLVNLSAADLVTVKVKADGASKSITLQEASLYLKRIG